MSIHEKQAIRFCQQVATPREGALRYEVRAGKTSRQRQGGLVLGNIVRFKLRSDHLTDARCDQGVAGRLRDDLALLQREPLGFDGVSQDRSRTPIDRDGSELHRTGFLNRKGMAATINCWLSTPNSVSRLGLPDKR